LQDILKNVRLTSDQISLISREAEQLANSSGKLVEAISQVAAAGEEASASTEEMSASSSQVVDAIRLIGDISQQSRDSIEEVTKVTGEITGSMLTITDSSKELAKLSLELQDLIEQTWVQ